VLAGLTVTEPERGKVPAKASIVTPVALGTFHVRVELPPGAIVEGEAVKIEEPGVGQATKKTVVCNWIEEHAPAPVAVKV